MKSIIVGLIIFMVMSLYVPSAFADSDSNSDSDLNIIGDQPTSLPEPASILLMATGLAGVAWIRRRKKR